MTPAPPTALYVHVPFCLSVCPYCDFVVYGGAAARGPRNLVAKFVDALATELELRAVAASESVRGHRPVLRSVYFGGGTPSLLTAQQIGRLLAVIDDGFGIAPGAEVTLETNPGAADRGDVGGFRAAGVTRLSIGAQSMIPGELRSIGRRHAPDDVAATVGLARRARMESVSVGPDLLDELVARVAVDELVHHAEALEGVLAVEDARVVDLVRLRPVRVEDAAAEVAVDRRAADLGRAGDRGRPRPRVPASRPARALQAPL
ncbi:MAG TPA: radical SAM protein, partial [Candidatus Caenarcaniphilales bacterium]|nr:radical SAM protein [Candidatus Caenarcaniphilales bacterium]